jgi:hypothetical protein
MAETIRPQKTTKKMSWLPLVIIIIVIIAIIWGIYYFVFQGPTTNATAYQAVFLDNGQVYFGQVHDKNSTYVTVEDVYYLRVAQPLQPADDTTQAVPDISLIKLGNELHGPTDQMEILRDHILFIENLKEDGKVVQAIRDYKIRKAAE